jgi:uncharacterized membrane protein
MTFDAPQWLWLWLAIPLVWAGVRFSRTNFSGTQRAWQAVVRSVLLATLALALAEPVIEIATSRLAVVYLVDVSHSVASDAIRSAADRIDALDDTSRPARSRILAFGAESVVLPDTDALRDLSGSAAADRGGVDRTASDLASALADARAELPPDHTPRVVLFSDGRPTTGDEARVVATLARARVPISTIPLDTRDLEDTWVDGIELPADLPVGVPTPIVVRVGSQRAAAVRIVLTDEESTLAELAATVEPGTTSLTAEVTFATPGARRLHARLLSDADPLPVNDQLGVEAGVSNAPRVLYVEGASESAPYLERALTQSGFDVTVRGPQAVPAGREALDAWDLVILSDVGRRAVSDRAMTALTSWVEQDGGGLLFAGGEAVFGEGPDGMPTGYRHTELERVLPVTFERTDEPELALVIVFDKSWSMEGGVIELCKAAAVAAVDVMKDRQLVGLVTFDSEYKWEVPLRRIGEDRDTIRRTIGGIEASGATRIFPALEQAYLALAPADARAKHVILLTDGRSYAADYRELVNRMVAAHITVSSVAVGPAADRELLANLAAWGGGRTYVVDHAAEVRQIFVKEAQDAAAAAFDEGAAIAPVVRTRAFLEDVDLATMPPLGGRTGVTLKRDATELLATPEGYPLFAFWQAGTGRTAVFASDVKDRWANRWIGWSGYAPFFASTARALARARRPLLDLRVAQRDVAAGRQILTVALEARDVHGGYRDLERPTLSVRAGSGQSGEVVMHQRGPGRYEATVTAAASEALRLAVGDAGSRERTERLVVPDEAVEYRLRPPDHDRLRGIAEATGGVYEPAAADLEAGAERRVARRDLWPWLVALAVGIWFADILLRRIRLA